MAAYRYEWYVDCRGYGEARGGTRQDPDERRACQALECGDTDAL